MRLLFRWSKGGAAKCHVGITGFSDGRFRQYKICDPSLHNWTALALSVRGAGISDFPICNKVSTFPIAARRHETCKDRSRMQGC